MQTAVHRGVTDRRTLPRHHHRWRAQGTLSTHPKTRPAAARFAI